MSELNEKEVLKEIQDIYKPFAKLTGRGNTFGCLFLVVGIIGVVVLWIFFSWKIAVPTLVASLILVTMIYSTGDKHGVKAKKAMEKLHEKYSLKPEQTLKRFKKDADLSVLEVKDFIKYVWGIDISKTSDGTGTSKSPKKARLVCSKCNNIPAMILHDGTASCYNCDIKWKVPVKPTCPNCGSDNVKSKLNTTTNTAGSIVGGALLGAAGSALGVKHYWTFKCNDCGTENWEIALKDEVTKKE